MKKNHNFFRNFFKFGNRLTFISLTLFLSFSSLKPAEGQVVAVFESTEDYLKTENNQYQTIFLLETGKETIDLLVSRALTMPETFTFKSDKIKRNNYRCSLLFIHPTDIYYVKKTLLNLGIEQLKINNKIYSLPDYEPVIK